MKKDLSRPVFAVGLAALGLGVLLLVASLVLGARPDSLALAKALLGWVPYLFLLGFALLVLYVVLRPKPEPASPSKFGTLFGKDTTVFASRMDPGDEEEKR